MKRNLTLVLVGSLLLLFPVQVLSRTQKDDSLAAEKMKVKITRLGVGEKARAEIKLRSGQKIKGYVSNATETDFAFTDRKSGQTITVAYSDVVAVNKPGMSKRTKIIIGVTIGVVAAAAIMAAAVVHSLNNLDLGGITIR